MRRVWPPSRPSVSCCSHSATSASGSAAASDSAKAMEMSAGSATKPRFTARHMEGSAAGRASKSRSGIGRGSFFFREALRLQVEHPSGLKDLNAAAQMPVDTA